MEYSIRNSRDLGAAIRGARNAAGRTQSDVAERAGISRSYLAQIEGGRSSRLLELVLDLVRLLDLELVARPRATHDG